MTRFYGWPPPASLSFARAAFLCSRPSSSVLTVSGRTSLALGIFPLIWCSQPIGTSMPSLCSFVFWPSSGGFLSLVDLILFAAQISSCSRMLIWASVLEFVLFVTFRCLPWAAVTRLLSSLHSTSPTVVLSYLLWFEPRVQHCFLSSRSFSEISVLPSLSSWLCWPSSLYSRWPVRGHLQPVSLDWRRQEVCSCCESTILRWGYSWRLVVFPSLPPLRLEDRARPVSSPLWACVSSCCQRWRRDHHGHNLAVVCYKDLSWWSLVRGQSQRSMGSCSAFRIDWCT